MHSTVLHRCHAESYSNPRFAPPSWTLPPTDNAQVEGVNLNSVTYTIKRREVALRKFLRLGNDFRRTRNWKRVDVLENEEKAWKAKENGKKKEQSLDTMS